MLPTFSKIYEKAVYIQLTEFLVKNHLIDDIQHGFCCGKSVITASIAFIESIIDSIDAGDPCIGIFMDLSKAFDSVNHTLLISKLKSLGMVKSTLDWFCSYLENRFQFVQLTSCSDNRISNHKSQLKKVRFGVPQGSILGPLLFICYLKNISTSLSNPEKSSICLYADDTNLKISDKTIEQIEILSFLELGNIVQFFKNHNLQLNVEKTNYISFKTAQSKTTAEPVVMIDSEPIEQIFSTKFLGLLIDGNLNWNEHVDKIISKINSGLCALRKMADLCSQSTLKLIYHSYIHSHISFGICLYGSTKQENLDKIQKLQKKAIRIIKNLHQEVSCREHFKNLQIITVYGQYIFDTIMVYKTLNSSKPLINHPTHPYNTRNKSEIIPTHHRLQLYTKKPSYAGAKFFRTLPKEIKKEKNVNKFKIKLKNYITSNPIYSIEEYNQL